MEGLGRFSEYAITFMQGSYHTVPDIRSWKSLRFLESKMRLGGN